MLETYDGILQKLNILGAHEYDIESSEDGKSIIFNTVNDERDFALSTKDAPVVNFDLTERIVKGICVDTKKRGNLYHRNFDRE